MNKIPLLRPELPDAFRWLPLYEESVRANRLSNFGPCYRKAQDLLDKSTSGFSLPVNNGTTALQTALKVHCPSAKRIAIPDFTFAATANACTLAGARPYLTPCREDTWTIDLDCLYRNRIQYDAFIVVSPFGYKVDIAAYDQFAKDVGKQVIYDFAAAYGGIYKTKNPICYSFQATKNLPIGEGGAVVFSSLESRLRGEHLINFDFDMHRFCKTPYGFNGKMDEIHAAILVAALSDDVAIDRRIARKKHVIMSYESDLDVLPHGLHVGAAPQLAVFPTPVATDLVLRGAEAGIEFRKYYHPLLSDMDGLAASAKVLGKSSDFFRSIVAFPTDLIGDEYGRVVDFVKGLSHGRKV